MPVSDQEWQAWIDAGQPQQAQDPFLAAMASRENAPGAEGYSPGTGGAGPSLPPPPPGVGEGSGVPMGPRAYPENAQLAGLGDMPFGAISIPSSSQPLGAPAPEQPKPWSWTPQSWGAGSMVPPTPAAAKPAKPLTADQEVAQGYEGQKQAAADLASVRGQAAQIEGQGEEAAAKANAERLAKEEAMRADVAKRAEAESAQIAQEGKELTNAKVDPDRLWHNASTPQKLAAAIAIAMGGWVAPKMGGKNPALDIITGAVERDVQAQMADLQNRRAGLESRRGLFATNYARWNDQVTAYHATSIQLLEQAKMMTEAEVHKLGTDQAKAEGAQAIAHITTEQGEHMQAVQQQRAALGMQGAGLQEQIRHNKAEEDLAGSKQQAELNRAQRESAIRNASGQVIGFERDKEAATKTQEHVDSYEDFRHDLVELMTLRDKAGGDSVLNDKDRRRMLSLHKGIANKLRTMDKMGVYREGEQQMLESMIPPPDKLWERDPRPVWQDILARTDQGMDRYVRTHGIADRYTRPSMEEGNGTNGGALPPGSMVPPGMRVKEGQSKTGVVQYEPKAAATAADLKGGPDFSVPAAPVASTPENDPNYWRKRATLVDPSKLRR